MTLYTPVYLTTVFLLRDDCCHLFDTLLYNVAWVLDSKSVAFCSALAINFCTVSV